MTRRLPTQEPGSEGRSDYVGGGYSLPIGGAPEGVFPAHVHGIAEIGGLQTVLTGKENVGVAAGLIAAQNATTKDFTGFVDTSVVSSYDSSTKKVTLTGNVSAYRNGVQVTALVSGWQSPALPTPAPGGWFLYWDGNAFVWSQTPWQFSDLMIGYVYYSPTTTFVFAARECHGLMDWETHRELHERVGTYLRSGGDLGGYTLASTTAANRRPTVSAAVVADEDLETTNAVLSTNSYTRLSLSSTGVSTFTEAGTDVVPLSGNQPYWNQFSTPNWVQTLMSNNSHMSVWLVAAPMMSDTQSQKYRYMWIQGQSNGSLSSEQALGFSSLNLGQLSSFALEYVPIGRLILKYIGGNWSIEYVEKLMATRVSPGGSSGALSTVTTDATMTGLGTVSSPLSVVQPVWGGIGGTLSNQTDLNTALGLKAPLASPTFTGSPTAPTVATSDNSTALATTAWVKNQGYGGAGSAAWGNITGTLSAQTDLQAALNAKQTTLGYTPINKAGDTGIGDLSMGALTATNADIVTGAGNASLNLKNNVGTSGLTLQMDTIGDAYVWQRQNRPMYLGTNGTTAITIAANQNVTFSQKVSSGGNKGFQNDVFYTGPNPIWAFGNAPSYGITYYQANGTVPTPGQDAIGFHFGDIVNPKFWVNANGSVFMGALTASDAVLQNGNNGSIRLGSATYYGTIQHDAVTTGATIYNTATASGGGHVFRVGGVDKFTIAGNGTATFVSSVSMCELTATSGATAQGTFYGYGGGVSSVLNGEILLGNTEAYRGRISMDAATGNTTMRFDSTYDSALAEMHFRLRTAGTPVTALKLKGDGSLTTGAITATQATLTSGNLTIQPATAVAMAGIGVYFGDGSGLTTGGNTGYAVVRGTTGVTLNVANNPVLTANATGVSMGALTATSGNFTSTTASTSSSTGAVVVGGGLGVGGAIYAGGDIVTPSLLRGQTVASTASITTGFGGSNETSISIYGADGKGLQIFSESTNARHGIYYNGANRGYIHQNGQLRWDYTVVINSTLDVSNRITGYGGASLGESLEMVSGKFIRWSSGGYIISDGYSISICPRTSGVGVVQSIVYASDSSDSSHMKIYNSTSAPNTPTGGGALYVQSGALKWKGSSGTVTTIAVA